MALGQEGFDFKLSLRVVDRSKANFERKLREARHSTKSIQHAANKQLTTTLRLEQDSLEEEFQELKQSFRSYESTVEEFRRQFEQRTTTIVQEDEEEQVIARVEQSLNEAQVAYLRAKQEIVSLLRRKPLKRDKDINKEEDEEKEDKSEESGKSSSIRKYVALVLFGLVAIFLTFFVYFLVISNTVASRRLQAKADNDISSKSTLGGADNTSCGANSFMLRDAVCDEATNAAVCLFDGGDCCLEFKATHLCKNCSCILTVDSKKLIEQFKSLGIRPLKNPGEFKSVIQKDIDITVEDVISGPVCAVLCLDSEREADSINSWEYRQSQKTCQCGWIESTMYSNDLVIKDWTLTNVTANLTMFNTFVQLNKTIPRSCFALGFLVAEGERTLESQKELAQDQSSALSMSAWHCQQKCRHDDANCQLFSWKHSGSSSGECHRIEAMSTSSYLQPTTFAVDSGWLTSTPDCQSFDDHFTSYLSYPDSPSLQFTCPGSESLLSDIGDSGNSSIASDFFIWMSKTTVEVHLVVNDKMMLLPCTHNLQWPTTATLTTLNHLVAGGIIQKTIVVCQEKNEGSQACFVLNTEDDPGYDWDSLTTSSIRKGAASLVIGNNDGTALWITGGAMKSTEILTLDEKSLSLSLKPGPDLPDALSHHCLVEVDDNLGLIFGGQDLEGNPVHTGWQFTIPEQPEPEVITWTSPLGTMKQRRSQHACGVLKDQYNVKIVVAAGGVTGTHDILLTQSVELLHLEPEPEVPAKWEYGPEMPEPLRLAQTVTTADQSSLFVIGGVGGTTMMLHSLQCWNGICRWETISHAIANNAGGPGGLALAVTGVVPKTMMSNNQTTKTTTTALSN